MVIRLAPFVFICSHFSVLGCLFTRNNQYFRKINDLLSFNKRGVVATVSAVWLNGRLNQIYKILSWFLLRWLGYHYCCISIVIFLASTAFMATLKTSKDDQKGSDFFNCVPFELKLVCDWIWSVWIHIWLRHNSLQKVFDKFKRIFLWVILKVVIKLRNLIFELPQNMF